MGFFPGMLNAPREGFSTHLIQVNAIGDCVVQRLDPLGRCVAFVSATSVQDSLALLARELSPNAVVRLNPEDRMLVSRMTDYLVATWQEVAAALNTRKPRQSHRTIRTLFHNAGPWTGRYLDLSTRPNVLTDLGRAFDAKFHPPTELSEKPPEFGPAATPGPGMPD